MPYYTYILRCEDGSLYTGITTDLPRRFAEHTGAAAKGAKYTAARRPVHYEAAWQSDDRSTASRLEYRIKTLTKPEKERLLQGEMPERLDFTGYVRINIAEASQNNSTAKLKTEELKMAKDSQLDPNEVRKQKANGGPTMAESALDGEGRNHKKQSSSRHKPGDDKR